MRFCIQQLLTYRDWQTEGEVYADALEEARLADELGFEAVWLAEHHFSRYGICPSLAVLAAAIARETRRVRIGTSVVVAPFAHPLRIAEEWAMVDILSGGRLEFGIGRGYQPKEFRGLGVSMEKTRERFDEAVEVIRRAWTDERVTFEGEFFQVRDLHVLPRPLQKPHPPLWTAAVSPDTYTLAARRGFKILTAPSFTPWDLLRKNFDAYRAAWREKAAGQHVRSIFVCLPAGDCDRRIRSPEVRFMGNKLSRSLAGLIVVLRATVAIVTFGAAIESAHANPIGTAVYDQLKNLGAPYSSIVEGVSFGSSPIEPPPFDEQGKPYGGPLKRRDEIWNKLKQWLEEPAGVQIPDSDSLQADFCGPAYHYDSLGRLVLESKEDMRRRGALSPDEGDAVALTFARPVGQSNFNRQIVYPRRGLV